MGSRARQPSVVMGLVVPQSNGVARRGQDMSAPSLIRGDHGTIPVAMCHWKARACASWSRAGDRARGQGGGDPEVVIEWFRGLDFTIARIRLEAGPLPQWMDTDMRKPDLILELLETRRVTNAFEVLRSAKTPLHRPAMRLGGVRPVDCKSLSAQEVRALRQRANFWGRRTTISS